MEQIVSVLRSTTSKRLILNPLGTFTGYGAYVGIYPYNEISADTSSMVIGSSVLLLLDKSVKTGFKIKEIDNYRKAQNDPDSDRIRQEYLSRIKSTKESARKFQQLEVSRNKRGGTLALTLFWYSAEDDTLVPVHKRRVRADVSPSELGAEILDLFAMELT